jgi:glutamate--cysteine ligase
MSNDDISLHTVFLLVLTSIPNTITKGFLGMDSTTAAFAALTPERIRGMRRGIEKESLRTLLDGTLTMTPHPQALGSALTHPHITTDFSESQLELITGVHADVASCLQELTRIHQACLPALNHEMLWVASMPCCLPEDAAIPIGQYGSSNVGLTKTVYRQGLGHRYGRRMQTISGIHYNWSLPDLTDADYFALIRNFRRHAFLLLYLFGASPAVCSTFVEGRNHALQPLNAGTLYLPYATSLRMGNLGYQSDAQASLAVSYNDLEGYSYALEQALTCEYAPYSRIGVQAADGSYQQLSTTLLQIENEFYSTIRPKRVIFAGERPLHALRERGVQYVEVRLLDLDPFNPIGISHSTACFLDVFLLHCWLLPSPPDTPQEIAQVARNQQRVAQRGREPGLMLERSGADSPVCLTDWAQSFFPSLYQIAQLMDAVYATDAYYDAVQQAEQRLHHPESLPSAQMLQRMQHDFQGCYVEFVRHQSQQMHNTWAQQPLQQEALRSFEQLARQSFAEQHAIEANDSLPFDRYLAEYLSPQRLRPRSKKRA